MTFSKGEVVLLPIPFTDLSSRKVRPAIIVGKSSRPGDLFVVPVSSQLHNVAYALIEWSAARLNVPCGVKSQIATIEDRLILKKIGTLSAPDQALLESHLRAWLGL